MLAERTPPQSYICGAVKNYPLQCVHELFEAQAARTPEAVAVEQSGQSITYRQLNARANQLAHYLRNRGAGPGTLIGVSLDRSIDVIVAIYGILKAGAAYVPLDPSYPRERLNYMSNAANLLLLITTSSRSDLFDEKSKLLTLDSADLDLAQQSDQNPAPLATVDDLIYVIFTSGSTGQPKAAAVYHRGFSNLIHWFVTEFQITDHDRCLLVSSLSFDLTQKNLYATLIVGGTLHLYPNGPYDISALSSLIKQHSISLINCTPSAFYPLIEPFSDSTAQTLESLKVAFLGGEPISVSRVRPWITHPVSRGEIANTYGPTECTDICGFYRLNRDNLDQYSFVPLGRPVDNVQMAIVNPDMTLCDIGQSGELCVGGAGVGAGYINDAELTSQKFIPNSLPHITSSLIYKTGDQARWHEDGVVEFLGRLDHQVKIRGFRIELPEIERAAETHTAVKEAIVVVKSDASSADAQLVCCYTLSPESCVAEVDLRTHLTSILPAHMVPSLFEPYASFPLSPNGKVDRKALTKLVQERPQLTTRSTSASESLEQQIHAAWCQLLSAERVGLDDNFFDAGGDSLKLARLHQHLESVLGRHFPITDLFANPTIRGMTQHLGNPKAGEERLQALKQRAQMQRQAMAARRRPT